MTLPIEAMNTLRQRREKVINNVSPEKLAALQTLETYITAKLGPKGASNVTPIRRKAG